MINLTDRAAEEIKGLLQTQNKPEAFLRVFVAGGGCSGFQYGMSLEDDAMEGDVRESANGINLLIDPRSAMYVDGAEVDFVESLMGGGFKIDNPNAASTCGCGTSFTPKEGEEAEAVPAGGGGCGSCSNSSGF